LDITSDRSAVDVNIEPAKDDILFIHNDVVLTALSDFFTKIYGQITEETTKNNTVKTPSKGRSPRDDDDFNVLLSGRYRATVGSNVHHVAQDISPAVIDESNQNDNVELRSAIDTNSSELLPADKDKAPFILQESGEDMISSDLNDKTTSTESRWKFNMYDSEFPPGDEDINRGETGVSASRIDREAEELDDGQSFPM